MLQHVLLFLLIFRYCIEYISILSNQTLPCPKVEVGFRKRSVLPLRNRKFFFVETGASDSASGVPSIFHLPSVQGLPLHPALPPAPGRGCKFIFASSGACFGERPPGPETDGTKLLPETSYGMRLGVWGRIGTSALLVVTSALLVVTRSS